jgi:catechol 2,3-dioxygenase-like lactoylglutathione lyase family enzyme
MLAAGAPGAVPGWHWCVEAPDRAMVEAFWHAGLAAGGTDDGPRPITPSYYAAFLKDPDGSPVEAVYHHLW